MQLDDLKQTWTAHGAMLERSLAINEKILSEMTLGKVRVAMAPYVLWRALEVAVGVAALLAAMSVVTSHLTEARYVVAAGALAVFAVAITAQTAYLLVKALTLDYSGPVATIQRDVERIKFVEYRALKWAVLGGVVIWLPAALVLFEALTGVGALARVNLLWLAANLLFGLVVLTAGQALSRKHVERSDAAPWARRLMDALSGRALRSAAGHLAELSKFERDEVSTP